MTPRSGVSLAALACVLSVFASSARAQQPAGVKWEAPSACPAQAWVDARITKHLGRAMRAGEHANITVTSSDAGFRMTVRTSTPGGSGQVSHEHADCSVLADLAALIVAMAIDPNAGGTEPAPPEPASTQQGDSEDPGSIRFVSAAPDSQLTRSGATPLAEVSLRARAIIGADRGSLPGVSAGVGAAVAALRPPWRLEASLVYWPAQRAPLEEMPQAGGHVSLFVGSVRSCFKVLHLIGAWSACGLVEVGDISARSYGVSQPGSGRFVWLALGGAASLVVPIANSVYFHIDTQVAANLRRPKFTLPAGLVHQPDAASVRANAGLELRFR